MSLLTAPDAASSNDARSLSFHLGTAIRPSSSSFFSSSSPSSSSSSSSSHMQPTVVEDLFDGMLHKVSTLPEVIIPDPLLPFSPHQAVKYLRAHKQGTTHHPTRQGGPSNEEGSGIAGFLNKIVAGLVACSQTPAKRLWLAGQATQIKVSSEAKGDRAPDLILLDGHVKNPSWCDVDAVGELCHDGQDRLLNLIEDVDLIFRHQAHRRFVLGLTFHGSDLCFHLFDRAGLISSGEFSRDSSSEQFLRIIGGLSLLDDDDIGYDPSISLTLNAPFIVVDGMKYTILRILFRDHNTRGRGTTCFLVTRRGKRYVVKDVWVDTSRLTSEAQILRQAGGISGIARWEADEIVRVGGVDDSTDSRRTPLMLSKSYPYFPKYQELENRVHRRLVLKDIGESLSTFASRCELLGAFIDVVKTLRQLYNEKGIIHGDISPKNIMFLDDGIHARGYRKGLLIDFDFAFRKGEQRLPHSGTLPFMAVDLLLEEASQIPHKAQHDLESLLYVICWMFTAYSGPGRRVNTPNAVMERWNQPDDWLASGRAKLDGVAPNNFPWVLDQFQPYFDPFKGCIQELARLFHTRIKGKLFKGYLRNDDRTYAALNVTHDDFLDVLYAALERLPEDEIEGCRHLAESELDSNYEMLRTERSDSDMSDYEMGSDTSDYEMGSDMSDSD